MSFSVETSDVPQTAGTAGDQGAIASPPPSPRSLLCYTAQLSDDKLTLTLSTRSFISQTGFRLQFVQPTQTKSKIKN